MLPRIRSGDLVTVTPVGDETQLAKGDVVLCKVGGKYFLHLIRTVRNNQYQISNNRGHVNGWITRQAIFGKLVDIAK